MTEKHESRESPDLDPLFRPNSVAIIGASPDATKGGGFLWRRLCDHGYSGRKYPVSKRYAEIDGVRCYPSVSDLDDPVDLAILAMPAAGVEGALVECARKGVKFSVIHAAGFAEIGEEGRELQQRVLEIARSGGMRLVGPNCMGLFCSDTRINTIVELDEADMVSGEIAFCGQSGWATEAFLVNGNARGLRFSTVVSSGNHADLDLVDYISFFGSDPRTRLIGAYVEGFGRGRDFLELASRVGASKPILIWKSGFSRAGSRAAMSHTGSIAGSREVWLGAARGSGVVVATGLEELVDLAVAFSAPLLPNGTRIGIIVEAGGGGVAAADACESLGLKVEPFSPKVRQGLKEQLKTYLPPFSGISNPLDLVWLPEDTAITICTKCVEMIKGEVDAVILMTYQPFAIPELRPEYIKAMCHLRDRLSLPIFVVPPYASKEAAGMKEFTTAGLPAFPSVERAVQVIAAAIKYQKWSPLRKATCRN